MSPHYTAILLFLEFACWAPEVKPPEPKLSPREIAAQNGEEFVASNKQLEEEIVSAERAAPMKKIEAAPNDLSNTDESIEESPKPERQPISEDPTHNAPTPTHFPFSTRTKQEIPLIGHVGGRIMMIPIGSEIDVLEKRDTLYRIMCKNCDPKRPFQAGFIEITAIDS